MNDIDKICRKIQKLTFAPNLKQVTGGGNGIGREICLELARCGCNIACLDLDFDAAQQLCIELRLHGVKANAYQVIVIIFVVFLFHFEVDKFLLRLLLGRCSRFV